MKKYSKWKFINDSGSWDGVFVKGKVYTAEYIDKKGFRHPKAWTITAWLPVDFETYYKQITDDIRNNS